MAASTASFVVSAAPTEATAVEAAAVVSAVAAAATPTADQSSAFMALGPEDLVLLAVDLSFHGSSSLDSPAPTDWAAPAAETAGRGGARVRARDSRDRTEARGQSDRGAGDRVAGDRGHGDRGHSNRGHGDRGHSNRGHGVD